MNWNDKRAYAVGIGVVSAMSVLFLVINLSASRDRAIAAVQDVARSQIQLVRSEFDRTLQEAMDLAAMATEVSRMGSASLIENLRRYTFFADAIANGGVYDGDGVLTASLRTGTPEVPGILSSDLRQVLRHDGNSAVFVENSTIWIVRGSSMEPYPVVGIELTHFERMYHLVLGVSREVSLFDTDGTEIARFGGGEPSSGNEVTPSNSTLYVTEQDGAVYAATQLTVHPFSISIEYPRSMVLAEWRRQIRWQVAYIVAGHIILILLYRVVRRQHALWQDAEYQRTVVRETNHRMKNHIALLDGILALSEEASGTDLDHSLLHETRGRLQAIGMIHEMLYTRDTGEEVQFSEYCAQLIDGVTQSLNPRKEDVAVQYSIDPVFLPVKSVRQLGLVVHELVTNSLKHATPEGSEENPLSMHILFQLDDASWELIVSDNGPGFPDVDFDSNAGGTGNLIIESVLSSLSASIRRENHHGAWIRIAGPLDTLFDTSD